MAVPWRRAGERGMVYMERQSDWDLGTLGWALFPHQMVLLDSERGVQKHTCTHCPVVIVSGSF